MPAFLIVLLGAVGAVAAARFLAREGRRVSETMDAHRAAGGQGPAAAQAEQDKVQVLVRDPQTGTYRPRQS
ncbi:hypothetical protein [Roseixanthobacter liquoris]|uniref:hypothetical protein n=1 Tax=Roseixanthobacter liquoris TaxID=3119921 RepID=UPI00372B5C0C